LGSSAAAALRGVLFTLVIVLVLYGIGLPFRLPNGTMNAALGVRGGLVGQLCAQTCSCSCSTCCPRSPWRRTRAARGDRAARRPCKGPALARWLCGRHKSRGP